MLADAELAGVPVDGAGGLIGQLTAGDPAIPAACPMPPGSGNTRGRHANSGT